MSRQIKDMQALQREVVAWGKKQFPGQSLASITKHLVKEAQELADKPTDRAEVADVLLLLLQAADRQDMTTAKMVEVAAAKLEINKRRQWGPADADGVHEHIPEEVAKSE